MTIFRWVASVHFLFGLCTLVDRLAEASCVEGLGFESCDAVFDVEGETLAMMQTFIEEHTRFSKDAESVQVPAEDVPRSVGGVAAGQSKISHFVTKTEQMREELMGSSAFISLSRHLGHLWHLMGITADKYRVQTLYDLRIMQGFLLFMLLSFFGICLKVRDSSAALFYSDAVKGQKRLSCEAAEPDALLAVFNQAPSSAHLRIVGRRSGNGAHHFKICFARSYSNIAFDVKLDLAPFLAAHGEISKEDDAALATFTKMQNPLAILSLRKRLEWEGWDEVSVNIKNRLRKLGFQGVVDVQLRGDEKMHVLQNRHWCKVLRCTATQLLLGITVVGGVIFLPYVWLRTKSTKVKSHFKVNINPESYWNLIHVGISAEHGFHLK